jgi:hypothetical protein
VGSAPFNPPTNAHAAPVAPVETGAAHAGEGAHRVQALRVELRAQCASVAGALVLIFVGNNLLGKAGSESGETIFKIIDYLLSIIDYYFLVNENANAKQSRDKLDHNNKNHVGNTQPNLHTTVRRTLLLEVAVSSKAGCRCGAQLPPAAAAILLQLLMAHRLIDKSAVGIDRF